MRLALPSVSTKALVGGSAVVACLLRFPGLLWPIRPDEAGFTLVARAWDAEPDSLYGPYWVDRPPPIIALVKLSDMIGGPYFLRFLAALGCALLVVAAARTAYLVAGGTAARWTAVGTAAITGNTMIDAVAAKGEILGLPVVVTSFWFALEALRLHRRAPRPALWLALAAGLLGMLALGLKQNMATGLAFGGVVLVVSALREQITWPAFGKLAAAALVGAAVPLGATIGWCLAAGVRLETLWYAVYGFRSDALSVIADESAAAPQDRALQLVAVFVATGMVLVVGWFLVNIRQAWRAHPAVTAATVVILLVDGTGLVLGGSYWRPYLFGLVPGVVLCLALVAGLPTRRGRWMHHTVVLAVVSCVVSVVGWVSLRFLEVKPPTEYNTGEAIGEVSEPGDTIVVFGGRADIVLASGLDSPYEYLWSLPMRGKDPHLAELTALLESDDAPTWFVEWVSLTAWTGKMDPGLREALLENYRPHGIACNKEPIWVLEGSDRDAPRPDCDRTWG